MLMEGKLVLLLVASLVLVSPAFSHDEDYTGPTHDEILVLQAINFYRGQGQLAALTPNVAAGCIAHEMAHKLADTPCSNTTGADTPFGQNPQLLDVELLDECDVSLANVQSAFFAPNCVPVGSGPEIAAHNITSDARYQAEINDTKYTGAGVGNNGVWYVLALATDQPDGNFGTTPGSPGDDDNAGSSLGRSWDSLSLVLALWVLGALFGR